MSDEITKNNSKCYINDDLDLQDDTNELYDSKDMEVGVTESNNYNTI